MSAYYYYRDIYIITMYFEISCLEQPSGIQFVYNELMQIREFVPLRHDCTMIDVQLVECQHVFPVESEVKHVQILFNVAWSHGLGDYNQLSLQGPTNANLRWSFVIFCGHVSHLSREMSYPNKHEHEYSPSVDLTSRIWDRFVQLYSSNLVQADL